MHGQFRGNTAEGAKAKLLLLNPPSGLYRRDDRCQSRVEDQSVRVVLPPIDLAQYAAVARQAGAEPFIADYPAMGADWRRYEADLESLRPGVVLFNVTTATLRGDVEAARLAKRHDPAVLTIARGDILDHQGERILAEFPDIDLALSGESEWVLLGLLQGAPFDRLPGAIWRQMPAEGSPETGASIRRNDGRALVDDLDALPPPARDLLDNALYVSPETGRRLTTIKGNRGCPFRCVFCPAGGVGGRRLRLRSVDSILGELHQCIDEFGIRDFHFDGDTFTMSKPWLLELCQRIERECPGIRWACNSRVDTMDADRAEALVRSGCVLVAFGVESGDQKMLDHMRKGARLEHARRAVAACKQAGLATHAFYIIGLPWETRQSLRRTLAFARELDTEFFDINVATPLPGTEFYDMAVAEDLIEPEAQAAGSYARAIARSRELSAEDLTRWRRRALLRLYLRPGYVLRTLARARRDGFLSNYVRAALHRLANILR